MAKVATLRCRVANLPPRLATAQAVMERGKGQVSGKWLYGRRWRRARELFLLSSPLCVECEQAGKIRAAEVVDHIVPHKGDETLFWNQDNWRSLCARCHNRATASFDGGFGNRVKEGK